MKAEFGFYSQTRVCMPRFYAYTSERSWEYSTFPITLNFMLFIYMVIAYVVVYKKATSMKISTSKSKDRNEDMQKRISRLLLTDFFCWIPVCIMAYVRITGVCLPPNAYIASAGFLLPINSAMNPLLYSPLIGQCISRARKRITDKLLVICPCHVDDATTVDDTGEQIREKPIPTVGDHPLELVQRM